MSNRVFRDFSAEFTISATRSSGPGGQHVNKVNTRVELRFHVPGSQLLTQDEKTILQRRLANRISKEGQLILTSQQTRSQFGNREAVIRLFYDLIEKALKPVRQRRPTSATLASREKRIQLKKLRSKLKEQRLKTKNGEIF